MGNVLCVFPKSETLKVGGKLVSCCKFGALERDLYNPWLNTGLLKARLRAMKEAWGDGAPDYFVNPENLKDLRKKVAEKGYVLVYTTAGHTSFYDCNSPEGLGIPVAKLTKVKGRWKLLPLVCEVCGAPATVFIHGPYEDKGGCLFFDRDARQVPVCEDHADRPNYSKEQKICNAA